MSDSKKTVLALWLFVLGAAALGADTEVVEVQSARATHRTGIIFGLNDPVPAVAGLSVGYNVSDFLRLTAGVGRFDSDYQYNGYTLKTKSVTYGGGFRLLVPGWDLSPVGGLSWATISTEGFPNDDHHFYAVAGLEWQTRFGLCLSAGYEQSFKSEIGGLPYVTAGWYFPIL